MSQLPQWFVLSHPTGKSLPWVPLLEHPSLFKVLAGPFRAALKIVSLLSHSGLQTPVQVVNSVFLDSGLPTQAVLLPQRPAVGCFLRAHPNPELQRLLSCLLSAPQRVPVPSRSLKQLCRHPSSPTTWCGWSPLPAGHPSNPPAPPPGPRCAASPAQQGSCLTSTVGKIWTTSWFPRPRLRLTVLWLNSGQRLSLVPRHRWRKTLDEGPG